jgi:hypothetical protein
MPDGPARELGKVTTPSKGYTQPRVKSGCQAATAELGVRHLECDLWPHADKPTSLHWDSAAGIWWHTDDEHDAAVAATRQAEANEAPT